MVAGACPRFGAECAVVVAGSFGVDRIAEWEREKIGRSHWGTVGCNRGANSADFIGRSHLGNGIYAAAMAR
jgi:hypothetical protein